MGKLVAFESLTLDGVMQAPGRADEDIRGGFRHGGWAVPYADEVLGSVAAQGMASAGPLLFGRRTYEDFYGFWPNQSDDNPFTPVLNASQKYVASTTLEEPLPWVNSALLKGDLTDAVALLKAESDKDITVIGSGKLVQTLIQHDLVDQFVLLIHPLVLGTGRRLFEEGSPKTSLQLVDTKTATTGVIIATYERARER